MFTLSVFVTILDYFKSMMKMVLIFFPEDVEDSGEGSEVEQPTISIC